MSVNFTDVVKQGPVKLRRKTIPLWKSRYLLLRKASSRGQLRLDCFRDEKTSQLSESVEKVINLQNVRSVTFLPSSVKRFALSINFNNDTSIHIAFDSDSEAMSWHVALQSLCLPRSSPLTAPSGMDLLSCASDSTAQEVFSVYLLPNLNLSTYGECLLQCTTETLYLLDAEDPKKRLIGWPLNAIRRYGRDNTKFTFESGRSCATGEGIFIFNTIYGEQIYERVHNASIAISKAYRVSVTDCQSTEQRHRPLVRSDTVPVPPRSADVDRLPLPPRQVVMRRHITMDRRRPLPPLPNH